MACVCVVYVPLQCRDWTNMYAVRVSEILCHPVSGIVQTYSKRKMWNIGIYDKHLQWQNWSQQLESMLINFHVHECMWNWEIWNCIRKWMIRVWYRQTLVPAASDFHATFARAHWFHLYTAFVRLTSRTVRNIALPLYHSCMRVNTAMTFVSMIVKKGFRFTVGQLECEKYSFDKDKDVILTATDRRPCRQWQKSIVCRTGASSIHIFHKTC